ncbi:type VII secretion target [Kibdelosporangium aridum]|uniref:Excreted virulence factor EspC, type VII ESX diderm n=1 Tax=Kibdelosporangium aridum TaxID=2030 RepID=A0A1W2CMY0_KIBAR|nr:type VII secretion target [Kibdelosporangium aridum]SMC86595.1 Excreted virulence factor EspC, type VII ESX diderm [Kibdelosporangium aridum]
MPDGFKVEPEALEAYKSTMTALAGEIGTVGTGTLSGVTSLPGDCFGKIGAEVGLNAAFQQAAQAQLDGVKAASTGLADLAKAVGDALVGYQNQQAETASSIKRAERI